VKKMLGPFATASRRMPPMHAAYFTLPFTRCRYCCTPPLSHTACASMSTTTSTTTRDRGDCYSPMEWAQLLQILTKKCTARRYNAYNIHFSHWTSLRAP